MTKRFRMFAALWVVVLVAAACGSDEGGGTADTGTPSEGPAVFDTIGEGEGELNLVAWANYTEKSWVKPFEDETGCKVNVTNGNTSDEMVNLMRQNDGADYDGVSASGDASLRLIAGGDVAGIETAMFPEFANVMPSLQAPPHNTVFDVHYGVPYVWGPNFLMYNTDVVKPAPTSWDVVFEADSPYAGKITAYESPIYIADAALYLKTHNPDLGITDPYELTEEQLNAATDLLKTQAGMVSKYWAIWSDQVDGFDSGDMVVGTAWPGNQAYVTKVPVASVNPSEGVTGWADTWMMSSNAQHPNCMLMWMDYTLRPEVQTEVAVFYGATPSNAASCEQLSKELGKAADFYHCGDEAYLSEIALWKTPLAACGDDRGDTCMDYTVWTQKWQEIRGG
jgi:putative spermidine/putrescine transport system substrate-binding protein